METMQLASTSTLYSSSVLILRIWICTVFELNDSVHCSVHHPNVELAELPVVRPEAEAEACIGDVGHAEPLRLKSHQVGNPFCGAFL